MAIKGSLEDIFNDDPFGLLNVKPKSYPVRNADERLISSFGEVIVFYEKNGREPQAGNGVQEHQLLSRLKGIRDDAEKVEMLTPYDRFNLLPTTQKPINSINDIWEDDSFGLLNTEEGSIFELKHIKSIQERESADFVSRRKPCKDFDKYEFLFKQVQHDLSNGKRKQVAFKQDNLRSGDFYIHNGILLLLENVNFQEELQEFKSGSRSRKDGRTSVIFENGTHSNMLYRSLYKALLDNGKAVSENMDMVNEEFIQKFNDVTDEDEESGYIYVLKSKSARVEITSIQNLYKIGYSKGEVETRIKNASQDPTYLMAPVQIITTFKCFNMNPQKFELLLHTFFGNSCLNLDVFGLNGKRFTPREWFIVPLDVIEKAIALIISGEVIKYEYDGINELIKQKLD